MRRVINGADSRISLVVEGEAEETVILLHGGPGMPDYLREVARMLLPAYRVVRCDQRDSGNSICLDGRFGLEDHVADLESVRQACRCKRVSLFGHSWGGLLAQLYAADYPSRVKRLFLCNPLRGVGKGWRAMERASAAYHLRHGGMARLLALGILAAGTAIPGWLGQWAARRMTAIAWHDFFHPFPAPPLSGDFLRGISVKAFSKTRRAAMKADSLRIDGKILPGTTPMTILFGERNFLAILADQVYARYPSARKVHLQGAGHWPWIENPVEFQRELRGFFGRTAPAAGAAPTEPSVSPDGFVGRR